MESRRDRFRQQLDRLESAGSPQQAIAAGFYVPRPTSSQRLVQRIELTPIARRVITGPIGSGKSTELLVLAEALNALPDVWAAVIDVSLVHDLSSLQEGSLIAAAGVWLQEQRGYDSRSLQRLREAAYGPRHAVEVVKGGLSAWGQSLGLGHLQLDSTPANRGVLQTPRASSSIAGEFARELRDAITECIPGHCTPVLLFDSLDRVRDSAEFRLVLERDAAALLDHGFGAVLTAPVATLWTHSAELRSMADSWDTLPYEDPNKDPHAREFFLEVLERRLEPELFAYEHRLELVHASGGVLRDLIELARNAVEEAYMNGRDAVGAEDIEASIARFGRSLSLGLSAAAIETLLLTQASGQLRSFDEATLRLLENRQILEHHDPQSGPYFEAHPALGSILRRWAKAS